MSLDLCRGLASGSEFAELKVLKELKELNPLEVVS